MPAAPQIPACPPAAYIQRTALPWPPVLSSANPTVHNTHKQDPEAAAEPIHYQVCYLSV